MHLDAGILQLGKSSSSGGVIGDSWNKIANLQLKVDLLVGEGGESVAKAELVDPRHHGFGIVRFMAYLVLSVGHVPSGVFNEAIHIIVTPCNHLEKEGELGAVLDLLEETLDILVGQFEDESSESGRSRGQQQQEIDGRDHCRWSVGSSRDETDWGKLQAAPGSRPQIEIISPSSRSIPAPPSLNDQPKPDVAANPEPSGTGEVSWRERGGEGETERGG